MSGESAASRPDGATHVVRLQFPDADLGDACVLCGEPAAAAISIPEVEREGWELDVPLCWVCLRRLNRPRRMAAIFALLGAFMIPAAAFATILWAIGVDLKAERPVLRAAFLVLFTFPFVTAAMLAVRGRKLRGLHVVEFDPESGSLALHFADPEIARRVQRLNPPPVAGAQTGADAAPDAT